MLIGFHCNVVDQLEKKKMNNSKNSIKNMKIIKTLNLFQV